MKPLPSWAALSRLACPSHLTHHLLREVPLPGPLCLGLPSFVFQDTLPALIDCLSIGRLPPSQLQAPEGLDAVCAAHCCLPAAKHGTWEAHTEQVLIASKWRLRLRTED